MDEYSYVKELRDRCEKDSIYKKSKKMLEKKNNEISNMYMLIENRKSFKEHLEDKKTFISNKLKKYKRDAKNN